MKIGLKRVLIGLLTVIVLALVGVAVFLSTLDPNTYKGKIQDWAYERYQRTLTIDGDLQLSLFPRIALAAQDIKLSERESDQPFVSVDSARFAVAIWPLLFDRFVVDHVTVSGFKAMVVRDAQGQFNFDDLLGVAPATEDAQQDAPANVRSDAMHVDIAGLALKDGELFFSDLQSGQSAHLSSLQLNTGRVTFDQPFEVTISAGLQGQAPALDAQLDGQALLKIDPVLQSYSAQRLSLQATGTLGPMQAQTLSLRGNVAYDGVSRMLDASQLEARLVGKTTDAPRVDHLDVNLSLPRFKADRSVQEFITERLSLRVQASVPSPQGERALEIALDAPQLKVSPEQAAGQPVQATFRQVAADSTVGVSMRLDGLGGNASHLLLKSVNLDAQYKKGDQLTQVELTSPAEWSVQEDKAVLSAIKGDVRINDAHLPSGSFEFPFIGSVHLDAQSVVGDINAVLSGTPLNFSVQLNDWNAPQWQFALLADVLDLDKLFPVASDPAHLPAVPAADTPDETTEAVDEAAGATADTATAQAAPETPALTVADAAPTEHAWLRKLALEGTIKIGHLLGRGLEAHDVQAKVNAKSGALAVTDLKAKLYDGNLTGQLNLGADTTLKLRLDAKQVQAEPFSRVAGMPYPVAGKANLGVNVQSRGIDTQALLQQLNGQVRLSIKPGSVRGLDAQQSLSNVALAMQAALAGRPVQVDTLLHQGGETPFTSLVVDAALEQGVANLKQVTLQAPLFQVTQGSPAKVDLLKSRLDTQFNIRVTGSFKGPDGRTVNLRGVTVPLSIHGPYRQLAYQVQWDKLGGKAAQQVIKSGLRDILNAATEGAASGAGDAQAGGSDRPEVEQAVQGLGKALKNIFKP